MVAATRLSQAPASSRGASSLSLMVASKVVMARKVHPSGG